MTVSIAQVDKPNLIGNIYTKEAINKMKESIEESMRSGFCGGKILHYGDDIDTSESLNLSKVTHQISKVDVVDDFLVVDVEFMSTPDGEMAKSLVQSAAGLLRPSIVGHLHSMERTVTVDRVISFDIIKYHEDFRVDISWKKLK
jgi:hypothetical protein